MKKSSKKLVSALCAMTFFFGTKAAKVEGITKTNVRQFAAATISSFFSLVFLYRFNEDRKKFFLTGGFSFACSAVSSWIDFASNLKKQNSSKKQEESLGKIQKSARIGVVEH